MKIALIGYGKMGKAIEEIALEKGHEIVLKIDVGNSDEFTKENLQRADAAIEFTGPHSAFDNVKKCIEFGVPVISGSTGWLDKWNEISAMCETHNGCLVYSSNYSIGVNLFFKINKMVAAIMEKHPEYQVAMEEIHHTHKKDAPSGTAVTLAEGILENYAAKNKWVNEATTQKNELSIISKRIDPAPGTHTVFYQSEIDEISINHTAHSRIGFASGSVLAAEFLHTKKGIFTMNDVLNL